jgi:hypothetical protein
VGRPCREGHACTGCGDAIHVGEIEFEVMTPGHIVIFLHRRCFDLWTREAAEASDEGDWRKHAASPVVAVDQPAPA